MRVRYWIGALLCIVALCCPLATQAAVRTAMPPGSFITKSVSNPEDLAKLIESDKRVAQRYSRHFGMGVKELAEYVRKNLRVAQLKTSGRYTTYYITRGDRVLVHGKSFKAGRKIFVAPDGKPVLDGVCGNPMVKSLPKVVVKVEPVQQVIETPPIVPPVVAQVPTAPPVIETPVQEVPQVVQAMEPQVEVLDLPPVEFSSAASLLSSGILPGLLTAAAASAVFSGGGDNPPVPEPAGLMVLGSSISMLAAGFGISRRRRHGSSS